MKTKTLLSRKILFFILLVSCISVSAQKINKEKQFNIYKHEIGIDFQNIFRGSLGTSIIYRRRMGEKKFVSLNDKRSLRVRLGGSGNLLLSDRLDLLNDTISPINFNDLLEEGFQCHLLVGYEWQKQKKRVQYFYGFETGIRYFDYNYLTGWSWSSINGYTYRFNDEKSVAVPIILLGGVKYFITPEFSIALETSFEIGYKRKKIDRSTETPSTGSRYERKDIKRHEIDFQMDYLSALNFSYYF